MIRLGLVEDHPLFASAVGSMLEAEGFDVVFVARDLREAREALRVHVVDGLLLDLVLPDGDGLDLLRSGRGGRPVEGVWSVVLSSVDDANALAEAERVGCRGFVSKAAHPTEIVAAIRDVASGRRRFDARTLGGSTDGQGGGATTLSPRELSCLALVAEGLTNREIADVLGVSPETVKSHLDSARQKLGAADRAQAVAIGIRLGLF